MQIRRAESLRSRNTLGIDASAAAYAEVATRQELDSALDAARSEGLSVLPLGEGSNIVLAGPVPALVLRQLAADTEVVSTRDHDVVLRVSAGHDWHALVASTLERGLYGLENLALIPGTVGAAPIQNIGAYGVEFAQFAVAVHAVETATGKTLELPAQECGFAYRDSIFKGELCERVVITAVDLRLSTRPQPEYSYPALAVEFSARGVPPPQPRNIFDAVVNLRRHRLPDPAQEPNCGSFFKNPIVAPEKAAELVGDYPGLPQYLQADGRIKLAAAWLIERAGWKGERRGPVGIHPGHALVLVNYGGGSGADVLRLADAVVHSVRAKFGVTLEMEPRVYGEAG